MSHAKAEAAADFLSYLTGARIMLTEVRPRWAVYLPGVDHPLAEYAATEQEALDLVRTLPQAEVYDRHDGKDEQLRASTDRAYGSTLINIWTYCGLTPAGRLFELTQLLDQLHPAPMRSAVAPAVHPQPDGADDEHPRS